MKTRIKHNTKIVTAIFIILITLFSSFPSSAVISPTPNITYNIIVKHKKGGAGHHIRIKDGHYPIEKIIAIPKKGYTFSRWTIKGKFEILKGNLTNKTVKLQLYSDCVAIAYFLSKEKKEEHHSPKIDLSSNSPKTGEIKPFSSSIIQDKNNMLPYPLLFTLFVFACFIFFAFLYDIRSLKKKRKK